MKGLEIRVQGAWIQRLKLQYEAIAFKLCYPFHIACPCDEALAFFEGLYEEDGHRLKRTPMKEAHRRRRNTLHRRRVERIEPVVAKLSGDRYPGLLKTLAFEVRLGGLYSPHTCTRHPSASICATSLHTADSRGHNGRVHSHSIQLMCVLSLQHCVRW